MRAVTRRVDNIGGLKVSESAFDNVRPYLELGLPVYVGSEPLIPRALAAGAAGAVSGIAAAFPDVVRAVVDEPTRHGEERLAELRSALEEQPFVSAIKVALGERGVPIRPDVRPPLRQLSEAEEERVRGHRAFAVRNRLAELGTQRHDRPDAEPEADDRSDGKEAADEVARLTWGESRAERSQAGCLAEGQDG